MKDITPYNTQNSNGPIPLTEEDIKDIGPVPVEDDDLSSDTNDISLLPPLTPHSIIPNSIQKGAESGLFKFNRMFWERLEGLASNALANFDNETYELKKSGALTPEGEKVRDYVRKLRAGIANVVSHFAEDARKGEEIRQTPSDIAGKIASAATQAGLSVVEIATIGRLTGSPTIAMTTLGTLEGMAEGKKGIELAKGSASSALLGGIFHGTSFMPKILSLPTTGIIFGGMKLQELSTVRDGIDNLTPEDKEDILVEALVGAFMDAPRKGISFEEFRNLYLRRGFPKEVVDKAEERIKETFGDNPDNIIKLSEDISVILKDVEKTGASELLAKEIKPAEIKEPEQLKLKLDKSKIKQVKPKEEINKSIETISTEIDKDFPELKALSTEPDVAAIKRAISKIDEMIKDARNALGVPEDLPVSEIGKYLEEKRQELRKREYELKNMKEARRKQKEVPQPELQIQPENQAIKEKEPRPTEPAASQTKPVEPSQPVSSKSLNELRDELDKVSLKISNIVDRLNRVKPDDIDNAFSLKAELDFLEERESYLMREISKLGHDNIKKAAPDIYGEGKLIDELADFELPEDARAVIEGRINPITGKHEVNDVDLQKKAVTITKEKKSFQDVRKDMTPAYMIRATKEIISAPTHTEMEGELMSGKYNLSNGVEIGWIDNKTGNFVSEASLKGGPNDSVKITEKITNKEAASILSILRNERGGVRLKPEEPIHWHNIDEKIKPAVRKLRDSFSRVSELANKSGMSVDEYLYNKGLSYEAIDLYKKIWSLPIESSEVVEKATKWQKKVAHEISKELNINHRDVAESIGIPRDKSMADYTYDEAARLNAVLLAKKGESLGEETYETLIKSDTPTNIVNAVESSIWRAGRYFLSPEIALSKTEAGRSLYQLADRQNVRELQHAEYIMSKKGLGGDIVEEVAPAGSESAKKIALVLDGKRDSTILNNKEIKVVNTLRNIYKHMLDSFVKSRVKDPEREQLIRNIAKATKYKVDEKPEEVAAILKSYKDRYDLTRDEMEALELLRNEVKNYMPHVFDKKFIIDVIKQKLYYMEKAGSSSKQAIEEYKDTLAKLEGGELMTYNALPKRVVFDYYKARHGMQGYKMDANVSFNVYVHGWLRKMYKEPFLKIASELYKELPPEDKPYAKAYIFDYMGWSKKSPVADAIKSYEWIRTLGFAGRSAITNTTQVLNTIVDVGIHNAYKGLKRAMTPEGVEQFKMTGLQREIPSIMFSEAEQASTRLERIRAIAGYLFNRVEFGLRLHAYHSGIEAAKEKGLSGEDAFWYAIDTVHRTQFRYGKVGMPIGMRGWAGVPTQFSSYTIKQGELLYKWGKEPGGIAKIGLFVALSYGVKYTADELLGIDLSNSLGFGMSTPEALETLKSISRGDWEEVTRHWKLSWAGGSGILPQNFPLLSGPFLSVIENINSREDGKWLKILYELEPIQAARFRDFMYAVKNMNNGNYPIYRYTTDEILTGRPVELKYNLTLKDLLMRTFIGKPSSETMYQMSYLSDILTEKEIISILRDADRYIAAGDTSGIIRLLNKYPGLFYDADLNKTVQNDILNLNLTREERKMLKDLGHSKMLKRKMYLQERE